MLLTARLSSYRRRLLILQKTQPIPRGAKLRIIQAEERAKPVADTLLEAYTAFLNYQS